MLSYILILEMGKIPVSNTKYRKGICKGFDCFDADGCCVQGTLQQDNVYWRVGWATAAAKWIFNNTSSNLHGFKVNKGVLDPT